MSLDSSVRSALTRSNRRDPLFVNGRWVQDVTLASALLQAYQTLLMVGRYPLATLFLQLPPETIDVNVHPAKAEVRFRRSRPGFSGVQRAVRRALLAYSPVPELGSSGLWSQPDLQAGTALHTSWENSSIGVTHEGEVYGGPLAPQMSGTQASGTQTSLTPSRVPLLRLVGQ
jgi:DNA mismatch repair protein MutL